MSAIEWKKAPDLIPDLSDAERSVTVYYSHAQARAMAVVEMETMGRVVGVYEIARDQYVLYRVPLEFLDHGASPMILLALRAHVR